MFAFYTCMCTFDNVELLNCYYVVQSVTSVNHGTTVGLIGLSKQNN